MVKLTDYTQKVRWWLLGGAALYLGAMFILPASRWLEAFVLLLLLAVSTTAIFAMADNISNSKSNQRNTAWRYLVAAFVLWSLANAARLFFWLLPGASGTMPTLWDWMRVAGFLAAVFALIRLSVLREGRFGKVRLVLDLAIIALALISLLWSLIVYPILLRRIVSLIPFYWQITSLMLSMIIASLCLRLVLLGQRNDPEVRLLVGLLFMFLCWQVADWYDLFKTILADRRIGWTELLWVVGYLFVLFVVSDMQPRAIPITEPLRGRRVRLRYQTGQWLPMIFAYLASGNVIARWVILSQQDWPGIGFILAFSILLIARQGVISGQNELSQYTTLIQTVPQMVFICNPEGFLQLANPAFHKQVLFPTRQGRHLFDYFQSNTSDRNILERANDTGWRGEGLFSTRSGMTMPVDLAIQPVIEHGHKVTSLVVSAHDLTVIKDREQQLAEALDQVAQTSQALKKMNLLLEEKVQDRTRELEAALEQMKKLNEELRELDRLKSEFIALVSHELRTPLANIMGGLELYLRQSKGGVSAETLHLVQNEVERLSHLVTTILDLSALEAGRFPYQLSLVNLIDLIAEILESIPEVDNQRVSLSVEPEDSLMQTDSRVLYSVIHALIDNAIKYAPADNIKIIITEHEQGRLFQVIDTGPGIPPEEQERMFELFHRLDGSDAREVYGYGLGLAMAKRFIEGLSGWIRIESRSGEGTRVLFWIPSEIKTESV